MWLVSIIPCIIPAQGESQISSVVYQMLLVFFLFSSPAICCIALELPAIHAEKLSQRMALTVPCEASAHSCTGSVLNALIVLDPHFAQVWAHQRRMKVFILLYDCREWHYPPFHTSYGGNYALEVFVSSICKDIFIALGGS